MERCPIQDVAWRTIDGIESCSLGCWKPARRSGAVALAAACATGSGPPLDAYTVSIILKAATTSHRATGSIRKPKIARACVHQLEKPLSLL